MRRIFFTVVPSLAESFLDVVERGMYQLIAYQLQKSYDFVTLPLPSRVRFWVNVTDHPPNVPQRCQTLHSVTLHYIAKLRQILDVLRTQIVTQSNVM